MADTKFRVWNEVDESSAIIHLKLVQDGDDVLLLAFDADGGWQAGLLRFHKGHMRLIHNVNSDLGFDLDSRGRISIHQ